MNNVEPKYHADNLLTMPQQKLNEAMAQLLRQAVVKGELKHVEG